MVALVALLSWIFPIDVDTVEVKEVEGEKNIIYENRSSLIGCDCQREITKRSEKL